MPRSSHGSRRAASWALAHKPRALPRIVRLGRAANDNASLPNLRAHAIGIGLVAVSAVIAIAAWMLR